MTEPVKVLAVDDDPSVCRLLEMALTKEGYQVTGCTESTRALELLKGDAYGCVLLDIRMKGVDGTELLPIIKHHFPTLPVIVVSAYCNGTEVPYYSSLGAFEVLTKPLSHDLLLDVVNRAIGRAETIPVVLTNLSLDEARDQVTRKVIVTALRRSNWNQVKASQLLGISRYSLIRWLRKLQITY